jgi:glycerol-3-phosphate O-acyltransferase
MAVVGRIVPVVPVPLIATVILRNDGKPQSELELKSGVEQLIEKLEAAGAHVYIPRKDLDYAVTVGLRMLTLRRLVEEKDGLYTAQQIELPVLRYYANSIAHLLR